MSWVSCIHGKTVGMRAAIEDGATPECLDCEELGALRKLETFLRAPRDMLYQCPVALTLRDIDSIRARRGPGAL
jgi:hypothetical protein